MTATADVVVVSYGEIGTKSSEVRAKMRAQLATNLDAVLADRGLAAAVEQRWARLYIDSMGNPDDCARAASEVPGVVWARPSLVCEPTVEAIGDALRRVATAHEPDPTFAVRANRAGPSTAHPFDGSDLEESGGRRVLDEVGGRVDLDDPGQVYRIDCRPERAFVSAVEYDGPGGLPVGTQGTVVTLVSGGLDSPVAAWQLMRRGCRVVPVYVDLGDYGGADHRARAVETVRRLRRRAPNHDTRLRVVSGGAVVEEVVATVDDTRMLSLRRAMLRMAATVAERAGADAVATGEAVGQKSSQTGPNLAATDAAVALPVHRPLLTWDKADIAAAARDLGTFDDSTLPVGCERVAPAHPETAATRSYVAAAEPDGLLERAAEAAREPALVE